MILCLAGIGYGIPLLSKVIILNDYFEAKFGLANGVMFTGAAIGMICLPPISEYLVQLYGWRSAMFIFAVINLNICVAGALMRQPQLDEYHLLSEDEKTTKTIAENQSSGSDGDGKCKNFCQIFKRYSGISVLAAYPILTIYFCIFGFHEVVVTGWVLFLVSYTNAEGYTVQTATFLSTLGGVGTLVARTLLGPLIDTGFISGRIMFFLLAIGGTLTMCAYPFVSTYWILAVLSFMAGFLLMSASPIFVIMLKEETQGDSEGFVGAVGLHMVTKGFGILCAGPITGRFLKKGKLVFKMVAMVVGHAEARLPM